MGIIVPAALELPQVGLEDALRILLVMAEKRDKRYDRAAAKWAARATITHKLNIAQSHTLLALVQALPKHPEAARIALNDYLDRPIRD